ncbi:hypothetical protein KGG73_gp40 [Streptomyces phage Sentinel]|uniref:Uncharacterized protein n=1 Tax=Streptomyces phage Sentinel TaxID=2767584 RepID=A0A873WVV9_9CAUD|nr:hypothetical protein KGG73_gp40 [Streptomyces phage Sentinel]QPB09874.1 hypothetical protein CPT_Sentinel_040 [Streptomyces phage Sentinel]
MSILPPEGMQTQQREYWDDDRLMYFWRNDDDGEVYSRPYNEAELAGVQKRQMLDGLRAEADEAIVYLSERIKVSLAYFDNPAPTPEEMAAQVKVLCDLAAYSAGTLKRMILVLGELTDRPM